MIRALLENGADVNLFNDTGQTPLMSAIDSFQKADILEVLLAAGAFITFLFIQRHYSAKILKNEHFSDIEIVLRYFFVQHFSFDIECMLEHGQHSEQGQKILKLRDECKQELQEMKSKKIGENFTLYEFIKEYASPRSDSKVCKLPEKQYDFNRLLKAIRVNPYQNYFGIISAKVGEKSMEKMLEEIQVYTVTYSPDNPGVEKKIVLNHEITCNIARFAPGDDMLRLIVAFYNPHLNLNSCTGQASNEKNGKEECVIECRKRP